MVIAAETRNQSNKWNNHKRFWQWFAGALDCSALALRLASVLQAASA